MRRTARRSPDGLANLGAMWGDVLSVPSRGGALVICSKSRDIGRITIGDGMQANGVIPVSDTAMVPR